MNPDNDAKQALEAVEGAEMVDDLRGLYIHILDEARAMWTVQGRIVGRDGDCVIVQPFGPTWTPAGGLLLFPLAYLTRKTECAILYRTREEFLQAGAAMIEAAAERQRRFETEERRRKAQVKARKQAATDTEETL